jgi:hypothetical protein
MLWQYFSIDYVMCAEHDQRKLQLTNAYCNQISVVYVLD